MDMTTINPDRAQLIESAGREWDANPQLHKWSDRGPFVADALREKNMATLDALEVVEAATPGGKSARDAAKMAAANEWRANPSLQRISDRADYINGNLIGAGMPAMIESERNALR